MPNGDITPDLEADLAAAAREFLAGKADEFPGLPAYLAAWREGGERDTGDSGMTWLTVPGPERPRPGRSTQFKQGRVLEEPDGDPLDELDKVRRLWTLVFSISERVIRQ